MATQPDFELEVVALPDPLEHGLEAALPLPELGQGRQVSVQVGLLVRASHLVGRQLASHEQLEELWLDGAG